MRFPQLSLARQMIAVTVAATVLTQTVIMFGVYAYLDSRFEKYEDDFELRKIEQTLIALNTADPAEFPRILSLSSSDELKFRISDSPLADQPLDNTRYTDELNRVFDGYGALVSLRPINITDLWTIFFGDTIKKCINTWQDIRVDETCPHLTVSLPLDSGGWLNAQSTGETDASIILAPILLSALTSLLGIGGSVVILARGITRPLRDLSEAADLLGRGETARPITVTGPAEVARTAGAFNHMQERLTRFVRDRTAMLAAINHDLRTPLTSLRLRAEFIDDPALRDDMIETTEEMRTMVDSYLAFSHQEAVEEEMAPVDLTALLEDLAAAQPRVSMQPAPETIALCRPVSIKRVFRNLIDNGVKYGQQVHIALHAETEQLSITFRDDGPGIPTDMYEEVFTPFTRLDSSRNITDGSVGLGLSIARSIIRKHGGDITPFRDSAGFGMQVTLPDAPRQS